MLTPDELAAIPFFAALSPVALADVGRAAADIRLNAGEYAVYEGEPPALFVVLEGIIEVIKLVDGIERKIGTRLPGKIFGEVPLVFGTQFQAGFRAGEPTRVLKLEARPYYAVAASSPELARSMDEQARERIGGLPEDCGGAAQRWVILFGNRWDGGCLDLRRFLSATRSPSPGSRRTTQSLRPLARAAAGGERMPGAAAHRRRDAHPARAAGVRKPAWPSDRSALRGLRHGHHWRRTGGSRRRRLRSLGGLARHRGRAGGAGRSGGDLVADRELSRLSERDLRVRNWRAGRSARPSAWAQKFSWRGRSARIDPHARRIVFDNGDHSRAHRHHRVGRELADGWT